MVKVSKTSEVTLSFDTIAAAQAGTTGTSEYIIVAGAMYDYDAAGTDLTTGDGRTWIRIVDSTPQFTSIDLGHATDTTLTRASAGRIAVEGAEATLNTATQTLTNKTLTSPTIAGGTITGNITYNDNVSTYWGVGSDLRAYHNGTNSFLSNTTGTFYIEGDTVIIRSVTGSEKYVECLPNSYTALYWDNQVRLWTGSNTVTFVGGAKLQELSATPTATAAYGISWVLNETPNRPMFTDDAGSVFRYQILPSTGPQIYSGSGSPEGVVTAAIGSLYMRTDGGAGTSLYVKESGTGNTGWVAK